MFERFTKEARAVVVEATRQASEERGDLHIGTEHLLIGVPTGRSAAAVALGWTSGDLIGALADLERADLERAGIVADFGQLPPSPARNKHLPLTGGAKESLARSLEIAIELRHHHIGPDHILSALAQGSPADRAVRMMRHLDIDPRVVAATARGVLVR